MTGAPRSPADPADPRPSALQRLLGGPPLAVFARLLFVSLLVGATLMWLDIRPFEVFTFLRRFIALVLDLGWDSFRAFGDYILAGAVLVVPVWLLMRLMSYRGR